MADIFLLLFECAWQDYGGLSCFIVVCMLKYSDLYNLSSQNGHREPIYPHIVLSSKWTHAEKTSPTSPFVKMAIVQVSWITLFLALLQINSTRDETYQNLNGNSCSRYLVSTPIYTHGFHMASSTSFTCIKILSVPPSHPLTHPPPLSPSSKVRHIPGTNAFLAVVESMSQCLNLICFCPVSVYMYLNNSVTNLKMKMFCWLFDWTLQLSSGLLYQTFPATKT